MTQYHAENKHTSDNEARAHITIKQIQAQIKEEHKQLLTALEVLMNKYPEKRFIQLLTDNKLINYFLENKDLIIKIKELNNNDEMQ